MARKVPWLQITAHYDTPEEALADDMQWHEWKSFLSGHWQKTRPSGPGCYPTADRDGHFSGYDRIFIYESQGALHVMGPGTDDWQGWWWSEPMPNLPKPGPWKDE